MTVSPQGPSCIDRPTPPKRGKGTTVTFRGQPPRESGPFCMAWKKEKRRGPVWNERQAWIFCGCSSCFWCPSSIFWATAGWWLETVALCAVDCFALISGYVGSTAKFRWSRVGNLWLGIVFYTLLLTALFAVWMPEVVSRRTWFGAIFPITSNQYWFMTCLLYTSPSPRDTR